MTVKARKYRYYDCRHTHDRRTGRDCTARYVRTDAPESAVWAEVRRVLTDPVVVRRKIEHRREQTADPAEVDRLLAHRKALADRQKRLVRLYIFGELDDDLLRTESDGLRREK